MKRNGFVCSVCVHYSSINDPKIIFATWNSINICCRKWFQERTKNSIAIVFRRRGRGLLFYIRVRLDLRENQNSLSFSHGEVLLSYLTCHRFIILFDNQTYNNEMSFFDFLTFIMKFGIFDSMWFGWL